MDQYLVFLSEKNLPKGGINDLVAIEEDLSIAIENLSKKIESNKYESTAQIYDLLKREVVYSFNDD